MNNTSSRKGFTLIELLASIGIMTVILSLTFAGVNASRARSRDAKRIADLRTIQAALEQHVLGDASRSYPPDPTAAPNTSYCTKYSANNAARYRGIYDNPCFADYLATVPLDPFDKPYAYSRPACFSGATTGKTTLTMVASRSSCSGTTQKYSTSYGLHVDLETNSPEGKNDFTPDYPKSLDLAP